MPNLDDINAPLTVVSGLPRSGTSMMMRMLGAGGMNLIVDQHRPPNIDNPHGYFEFERVKTLATDAQWLMRSDRAAIKIISLLLPELPVQCHGHILFMKRPVEEIIASQRKMLRAQDLTTSPNDKELAELYERHLAQIVAWLQRRPAMKVCHLNYHDILNEPHDAAKEIAAFLSMELDTVAMADMVDIRLYRQRS